MDPIHRLLINFRVFDIHRDWDNDWGDQISLDFAGARVAYFTQYPEYEPIYISGIWDHTIETIPADITADVLWEKIMVECRPWFRYFRMPKEKFRGKIISENDRWTAACIELYPAQSKLILCEIKVGPNGGWPNFKQKDEADCAQFLQLAEGLHQELPLPIAEEITAQLPARWPFDDYCYGRAPKNWDTVARFCAEFDQVTAAAAREFPRAAKLFPVVVVDGRLCCVMGGPLMSDVEAYVARKNAEYGHDVL